MEYFPRHVDELLAEYLASAGAVILEGPRFCGKTETASRLAESKIQLDDEVRTKSPNLNELLEGPTPRLIDEWQVVPEIWNKVRHLVDQRRKPGQFILTGSAAPDMDPNRHSGAGRFQKLKMRTMTLAETGYSNLEVSLTNLFEGKQKTVRSDFDFDQLLEEICRGGWPALQGLSVERATARLTSYLQDTAVVDYSAVDASIRTPERIGALIRSIARNTGTHKNIQLYAADLGEPKSAHHDTIERYFEILRRLHLLDLVPGSSWQLRSRATLRSTPRVYLTDPSLAVAATGASPSALRSDRETLGFLFENLVIRDLISYLGNVNGSVSYYRDSSDLEVDAILKLWDGRWAAIEIKLGERSQDEAAKNLLRLAQKLDSSQPQPSFSAVITNGEVSYLREDGIWVIALQHLAP